MNKLGINAIKPLEELALEHYESIKEIINRKRTKKLFEIINNCFIENYQTDLKTIVISKPFELRNYINQFSKNSIPFIYGELFQDIYKTYQKSYSAKLINELNVSVCPYCNRNYIFKFHDTNKPKLRTLAELDHFYCKSKYPFLAVSFFNLIPACSTCNSKFKGDIDFNQKKHIHPYEESFDQNASFHLNINEYDFDHVSESFSIKLTPNSNIDDNTKDRVESSIKTFKLNDLYEKHKDIVLEIIQKKILYNESYIDELLTNYQGILFENKEDVLRLVFGGYITEDSISKRPLSKLIKDILKELDII